jgi:hypothetical protein
MIRLGKTKLAAAQPGARLLGHVARATRANRWMTKSVRVDLFRPEDEFIRPADAAQSAGDLAWRDYGESSFSYSPTSVGGCFAHRYPAAACSKPNS